MAKVPVVDHIAENRAAGAAIAELQGAGGDRGAAEIEAVAGQDRGTRSDLLERAVADDAAAQRCRVGTVDGEGGMGEHISQHRPAGAAVAELQRPTQHRGQAGIGVGARQDQRSVADLDQRGAGAAARAAVVDRAADGGAEAIETHE